MAGSRRVPNRWLPICEQRGLWFRLLRVFCVLGMLGPSGMTGLVQAGILPDETPIELTAAEVSQCVVILEAQWAAARGEIQAAAIQYDKSGGAFVKPYVESERLLPLLEEYGVLESPRRVADVLTLLNERSPPFRKQLFHPRVIYVDGLRLKTDDPNGSVHVLDPDHHYYYDRSNREIHLYHRGQSSLAIDHPQVIRPIPMPDSARKVTSILRYPRAGLLQLNFGTGEGWQRGFHLVYETSGLPYFVRNWDSHNSRVYQDEWIFNYATYPGEIEFPGVHIKFRYRNGLIDSCSMFFLTSAEFNAPVRPSDLGFSAPAGSHLRDERNPQWIDSVTFTRDEPDVQRYVAQVLNLNQSVPPPATSLPSVSAAAAAPSGGLDRNGLLWMNGLVLFLLGLFCWRWKSPGQSPVNRSSLRE